MIVQGFLFNFFVAMHQDSVYGPTKTELRGFGIFVTKRTEAEYWLYCITSYTLLQRFVWSNKNMQYPSNERRQKSLSCWLQQLGIPN